MVVLSTAIFFAKSFGFTVSVTDSVIEEPFLLKLKTYNEGYLILKDSVLISDKQKTNIQLNTGNYTGFAELSIGDNLVCGFIINKNEPNLNLRFNTEKYSKEGIAFNNTKDNLLYSELLSIKEKFNTSFRNIYEAKSNLMPLDSFYLNKQLQYEHQYEQLYNQINIVADSILKKDSLNYTSILADFLKVPTQKYFPALSNSFDNYDALLHYHYFDFIDFSNPLILNHPALKDYIYNYFTLYCINTPENLKQGIDIIMKQSNKNTQVKNYVFNVLIDLFLEGKNDAIINYLYENYADGCAVQLPNSKQQTAFESIVYTQVGATIPNIILNDSKNELQSLLRNASKNKYTIVYVWMSNCHACETKTPKLAQTIAPYLKKGLGVYSISLDEEKDDWFEAIVKYDIKSWTNVSELTALQNASVLPKLNIRATPKLFIIDKNGIIVAKDIFGTDLLNKLDELLN